jgi:hypothetical protein
MAAVNKCAYFAAAASLALAAGPAAGQPVLPLEYAAKFVCGPNAAPGDPAAAPGHYFTAINVHNPFGSMPYTFKVAVAGPARPGGHTKFIPLGAATLDYDDAAEFDCTRLRRLLAAEGITARPFFTGYFVIESRTELDVVAVYTASASSTGTVTSIHTERVPMRKVM